MLIWCVMVWYARGILSKKCMTRLKKVFKNLDSKKSSKTEKSEHHHRVIHFWNSLGAKFQLKLTTSNIWAKLTQKWYFWCKNEKKIILKFYILVLLFVPNFNFNENCWVLEQISPKRRLPVKNRKNKHHHWTFHILVSLSIKFLLKLTILVSWIKFGKKDSFQLQTEKANTTFEFCIVELV